MSWIFVIAGFPFAARISDFLLGTIFEIAFGEVVRRRLGFSANDGSTMSAEREKLNDSSIDDSAEISEPEFTVKQMVWVRDSNTCGWAYGTVVDIEEAGWRDHSCGCSTAWVRGGPVVSTNPPGRPEEQANMERDGYGHQFRSDWSSGKRWAETVTTLPEQRSHKAGDHAWVRDIPRTGSGLNVGWQWAEITGFDDEGRPLAKPAKDSYYERYDEVSGFEWGVFAQWKDAGRTGAPFPPGITTDGPKPWTRVNFEPTPGFTMQTLGSPDSSWELARQMNSYGSLYALFSGTCRLFMWHLAQPVVYFYVFHSEARKLDTVQQYLGMAVAVREAIYFLVVLGCVYANPAFLIVDVCASVRDKNNGWSNGGWIFLALYIAAPEKYVGNALLGWGGVGLTTTAVRKSRRCWSERLSETLRLLNLNGGGLLDCCGLGALIAGLISGKMPAALAIGYCFAVGGVTGLHRAWFWSSWRKRLCA